MLTESGDVYETTITGGRLGMLVFGQQDVIWSRLEARCADRSVEMFISSQEKRKKSRIKFEILGGPCGYLGQTFSRSSS